MNTIQSDTIRKFDNTECPSWMYIHYQLVKTDFYIELITVYTQERESLLLLQFSYVCLELNAFVTIFRSFSRGKF